jgi:2-dehydro-3-deoxyphosphooctonate aldolase (KDO 8-P synthase)
MGCPVFFDATHSVQQPGGKETGGQRDFVPLLSRAAIAAGADGLFIETHPDPKRARSDSDSQWPLSELPGLLRSLLRVHQALADTSLVEARRT